MPTGLFSAIYTAFFAAGVAARMRARTISPSTRTSSPSSAFAPVLTTSPLMVTRPATSSSSASRREHRPASLMYLLTRTALRAQAHAARQQAQGDDAETHDEDQHHDERGDDGHVAHAEHAEAEGVDHVEDRVGQRNAM